MVEVNNAYKHDWHERIWLKVLRVMSKVKIFFMHGRAADRRTDEHD